MPHKSIPLAPARETTGNSFNDQLVLARKEGVTDFFLDLRADAKGPTSTGDPKLIEQRLQNC